jgi:serine/threonine-protein kinase/endoribonuclease IRE1
MAPALYFLCIFFTLCIVCLAEVISLRGPNPAAAHVQDLVQRTPPTPYPFITTSTTGGHDQSSGIDSDLLDIVLVASVDGKLHALNRTSGDILWSMSSFSSSSISSFTTALGPLVKTSHVNYDPEGMDEDNQELYIVEPQSGDIYVKPTPDSPLQRFPFSMSELVDMSPFSFADSKDRRVFVGRKETSLLLVELETGKVKATLNSECPWVPFEDFPREEQIDLDELEDDLPHHKPRSTEVFIGRTGASFIGAWPSGSYVADDLFLL